MFCGVFAKLGLKITAQANLHVFNFLNITLNLENGKYMPYRKPDDPPPCYVNSQSNHPPAILKQLPAAIGKRVSSLYHATLKNSIRQSLFMTLLCDLVVLPVN